MNFTRDQFAYKITVSTTSALVYLTDTVGRLLYSEKRTSCQSSVSWYLNVDSVGTTGNDTPGFRAVWTNTGRPTAPVI